MICLIAFCSLNVYIQGPIENKAWFSRLRFLGFSTLGQSFFFFLIFTFRKPGFFHKPIVIAVSFIPALVTWMTVLIPSLNHFIITNYAMYNWENVNLISFEGGQWFPIHIITTYLFILGGVSYSFIILSQHEQVKSKQITFLALGALTCLCIDYFCTTSNGALRWSMLSGAAMGIMEGSILISIMRLGLLDLAQIAKDQIFYEIPDPVLVLDVNNRILDFNKSLKNLFNLSRKDIYRSITEVEELVNFDLSLPSQEIKFNQKYFNVGQESILLHSFVRGKILLFREITAQKVVEEKLSNHLEFKARLLSMIAHDFTGVLKAQSNLASSLELEVTQGQKSKATTLIDSTFSSKDFMTNILLWARAQENKFEPIIRPFEMNTLVNDVIQALEGVWKIRDLKIHTTSQKIPLILQGDSVMIESVMRNILANAIQASSNGQSINIHIHKSRFGLIKILIQDQGIGMSPKQLQILQKSSNRPFGSSDEEDRPNGFGIGIAIAKRFAELHGGQIEFFSEEGKGTLVALTLPA